MKIDKGYKQVIERNSSDLQSWSSVYLIFIATQSEITLKYISPIW
jgi:hypothetical protein